MVDYADVAQQLINYYPSCLAVAIIDGNSNQLLYATDNWDPSGDISRLMSGWKAGTSQFFTIQGVKYSVIQCTGERLISTNFGKQGHLIGASTPGGEYYLIGYISPDAEDWSQAAYPSVARAVSMLVGGSSIEQASSIEVTPGASGDAAAQAGGAPAPAPAGAAIDPNLKAEIEAFLQWIKDPQGLAGYMEYYIQNNDVKIINQLAAAYNEFRRIFNF